MDWIIRIGTTILVSFVVMFLDRKIKIIKNIFKIFKINGFWKVIIFSAIFAILINLLVFLIENIFNFEIENWLRDSIIIGIVIALTTSGYEYKKD